MKTIDQVSADKLRGGFYTPEPLVRACLDRIDDLGDRTPLRILEPSAGAGAFLRGLGQGPLAAQAAHVTAIEPNVDEAAKARASLAEQPFDGRVVVGSAIAWAAAASDEFDAAVGNPPFVRYQFISASDRAAALALASRLGLRLAGVSNLWIAVFLGALSRLRAGGAFAFVIPTECLTGVSSAQVRRWLIGHCEDVRFDLFAPGSFPDVLQEITILSGRRHGRERHRRFDLRLVEHFDDVDSLDWTHQVGEDGPWTKFLLAPHQVEAMDAATADLRVATMEEIAKFVVSIVTGANDFFTVPQELVDEHGLEDWTVPLLPRVRYAPGLVYSTQDHENTTIGGARAWLTNFSDSRPDPRAHEGAARYLALGESRELHERYKCRIREPWFRVPGIRSGQLLMSKRSHLHPRVVVNEACVYTSDTIYRGKTVTDAVSPGGLAANFHNSLTLLSAELEGRSFGGGVLELVPSEIDRLLVHTDEPDCGLLPRLDEIARGGEWDAVIAATDTSLVDRRLIDADVMSELAEARLWLRSRRLDRNRRPMTATV